MKNRFDRVIDYIDDCIISLYDDDDIKKGIRDLIGYDSYTFSKCLQVLTRETLTDYIKRRKFFFASEQLKNPNNNKRILDIAIECGYTENAVFTRQMKYYYGVTPSEIRNGKGEVPNEKLKLEDLCKKPKDSRVQKLINSIESGDYLSLAEEEFFVDLYTAVKNYNFDIDTGYAIAEIAEKLGVSVFGLMHTIFEFSMEEHSELQQIPSVIECALNCNVRTEHDLMKICRHYSCSAYDLTPLMVEEYYNTHK